MLFYGALFSLTWFMGTAVFFVIALFFAVAFLKRVEFTLKARQYYRHVMLASANY